MRRLFGILLGCLIFSTSAVLIHNAFLLNDYRANTSNQKAEILIEPGDSGSEIAQKLYDSGVIKASKVFYKIARLVHLGKINLEISRKFNLLQFREAFVRFKKGNILNGSIVIEIDKKD